MAPRATVNVENLTTEERARLVAALREMSNSFARATGEREFIRESTKKIADDLKLPKKLIGKLVQAYNKQNFDEQVLEHEQFEKLYKAVIK